MNSNISIATGYHGTYREYLDSIINTGFRESIDHNMWFGDGCYFFVDGLQNPEQSAWQYVTDKAKREKYVEAVCVLKADILVNSETFLDLTHTEGLNFFNSFRDEIVNKILKEKKKKFVKGPKDHSIMQDLRQALGVEFVKGHVHIKFGDVRTMDFVSRIPNVTIFVVSNPAKNIDRSSTLCLDVKGGEL